jgi:hypothetical protein
MGSSPRLAPGWFAVPPGLALLAGLPLAGSIAARLPGGEVPPWAILGAPLYLALLAAPGYIACLAVDRARLRRTALRRAWVRASVLLLLGCALLGVWAGTLALPLLLPALATVGCCVVIASRFERPAT